jgi:hypothetical protein
LRIRRTVTITVIGKRGGKSTPDNPSYPLLADPGDARLRTAFAGLVRVSGLKTGQMLIGRGGSVLDYIYGAVAV